MPKIDSISTTMLIDSTQNGINIQPTVIHDTIYKTVEKIEPQTTDDAIQFVSHNIDNSIPALLILGLVVIGVGLFLAFQILTNYIAPYLKSHYKIKRPYLMLFRVKTITWFIYIIFCFYQLVSSHIIIGFGLTIFISLIGINFWKDFFAGIYIKFEGRLRRKDFITVNAKKGEISHFYTRNLELKNENDEVFMIPYHKLMETSIAKRLNKGEERSRTIKLTIDEHSEFNSVKAIEGLLAICPWIYAHKTSTIKKIDAKTFAITIYVADNFSLQKIERFLNNKVQTQV